MNSPSIGRRVGSRLRQLRKQAGLTQSQLGSRAGGIAAAEISKFENARRSPCLETLERLSHAIGVPMSELVDIGDALPTEEPELQDLVLRLRGQPPEQIRRMVAILDALIDAG
ncbi:MAG: helix-turn-helix transcriptional regulator [Alphaproteobacteria bacterium]|nr:helix-turn-helix transcriptional regulator [Alphaproteobacteria bacterium]